MINRFQLAIVVGDVTSTEFPSIDAVYLYGSVYSIENLNGQVGVAVNSMDQLGWRIWTMQKGYLRNVVTGEMIDAVWTVWPPATTVWADDMGNPTMILPPPTSRRVKLGTVCVQSTDDGLGGSNSDGMVFIDVVVYPGIDDLTGVDLTIPALPRELLFFTDMGAGVMGLRNRVFDHGDDPEATSLLDDDHPQYGKIQNGFVDRSVFTLAFDDLAFNAYGRLSIGVETAMTGRYWSYGTRYVRGQTWGQERSLSPAQDIPQLIEGENPNEGLWYFYFDNAGVMQVTQVFSDEMITDRALICVVYWDSANKKHIRLIENRHGREMDGATRLMLHHTEGLRLERGLTLGQILGDADGSLNTHTQCAVLGGAVWDADIQIVIEHGLPQTLQFPAAIPIFYRAPIASVSSLSKSASPSASPSASIGSSSASVSPSASRSPSASFSPSASASPSEGPPESYWWRKLTATSYPISVTGSGRAAYNKLTGTTWSIAEATDTYCVLTHVFATGDMEEPIIAVMGFAEYSTPANAELGAVTEIESLLYGLTLSTLVPKVKALGTLIFQTATAYANAYNSRIRKTAGGKDYIDWRWRY